MDYGGGGGGGGGAKGMLAPLSRPGPLRPPSSYAYVVSLYEVVSRGFLKSYSIHKINCGDIFAKKLCGAFVESGKDKAAKGEGWTPPFISYAQDTEGL